MPSISKRVREAIRVRLESAWTEKLTEILPDYALTEADQGKLLAIDWTGTQKTQLFQSAVDFEAIAATTSIVPGDPLISLYSTGAQHDGQEKFVHFSGTVGMALEFVYSWSKATALPDFEEVIDAIEDAIINVLHDPAWLGFMGSGITYVGDVSIARTPVIEASSNWLQSISFQLRYGVDI